jgi:predicted signal transduction protein with EAL and GGDEF domain
LTESFDELWARDWSVTAGCPLASISFGVAEFEPPETSESLIRRADEVMYAAKKKRKSKDIAEPALAKGVPH